MCLYLFMYTSSWQRIEFDSSKWLSSYGGNEFLESISIHLLRFIATKKEGISLTTQMPARNHQTQCEPHHKNLLSEQVSATETEKLTAETPDFLSNHWPAISGETKRALQASYYKDHGVNRNGPSFRIHPVPLCFHRITKNKCNSPSLTGHSSYEDVMICYYVSLSGRQSGPIARCNLGRG